VALSGQPGTPVTSGVDPARDVVTAAKRLAADPHLVAEEWTIWKLDPIEVEFWQGSETRLHTRLRYRRGASGWAATQLRP